MWILILQAQVNNEIGCPILRAFFAGEPALSGVEGVGILISMVFRQSQNPRPVFRKKRERQGRGTLAGVSSEGRTQ
jgi:hypothetical protein